MPFNSWPVSGGVSTKVPPEELATRYRPTVNYFHKKHAAYVKFEPLPIEAARCEDVYNSLVEVLNYLDKLDTVLNILARLIKGSHLAKTLMRDEGTVDKERVKLHMGKSLSATDLDRAMKVALKISQPMVKEILMSSSVTKKKNSNLRKSQEIGKKNQARHNFKPDTIHV